MTIKKLSTGNVGDTYQSWMLPYGGRVDSRGIITYVVSYEEYVSKIDRLLSIDYINEPATK